jgi:hypothetical protein
MLPQFNDAVVHGARPFVVEGRIWAELRKVPGHGANASFSTGTHSRPAQTAHQPASGLRLRVGAAENRGGCELQAMFRRNLFRTRRPEGPARFRLFSARSVKVGGRGSKSCVCVAAQRMPFIGRALLKEEAPRRRRGFCQIPGRHVFWRNPQATTQVHVGTRDWRPRVLPTKAHVWQNPPGWQNTRRGPRVSRLADSRHDACSDTLHV